MQATGGNWAPTCKQRCPWGRLLCPSTLRSRASDQMQRGQHVVAARSLVSSTSRTGANHLAGAAPSPRCRRSQARGGDEGSLLQNRPASTPSASPNLEGNGENQATPGCCEEPEK